MCVGGAHVRHHTIDRHPGVFGFLPSISLTQALMFGSSNLCATSAAFGSVPIFSKSSYVIPAARQTFRKAYEAWSISITLSSLKRNIQYHTSPKRKAPWKPEVSTGLYCVTISIL